MQVIAYDFGSPSMILSNKWRAREAMILIARLFVRVVSGFPLRVWLSLLTYGDVGVGRVAVHGVGHHACMESAYHVGQF
jgi:hypothetical protein